MTNGTLITMAFLSKGLIVTIIVTVVLIAIFIALYFAGKKLQQKQAEQAEQMKEIEQTFPILVIDKKKMKVADAGFSAQVMEQIPKRFRRAKLPIVKAKVGPKIMSFICDEDVFEDIPVKKEVKATISGLYITGVKGMRKPLEKQDPKKKSFMAKLRAKVKQGV
jgi:hypothetical protein